MKKLLRSLLAVMLISMMAMSLASCGAPKPEKVKKNLEKAGYTVMLVEGDEAKEEGEGIVAMLTATKGVDFTDYVSVEWFADKEDAKKAEEDAKEAIEKMGDKGADYVVKRAGKCVWMGHKDAVKAM